MSGKVTSTAPGRRECVNRLSKATGTFVSLARESVQAGPELENCVPLTKSDNPSPDNLLDQQVGGYSWREACAGVSSIMADNMAKYRDGAYDDDGGKPRFSADSAEQKFARSKDAERYALREFSRLTTVWFSFTIPERSPSGELRNPVAHAEAYERAHKTVHKNLYRKVRDFNHAGVWVRAARESGYVHAHGAGIVEGIHKPEKFYPVVDSFTRNAAKALDGITVDELQEANPYSKAVSVNYPTHNDCSLPTGDRANTEIEQKRGITSALPNEIGGNLEALGTESDITDTWTNDMPSPEVRFAAIIMELGTNVWRPFGAFNDWADREKNGRNCEPLTKSDRPETADSSENQQKHCSSNRQFELESPARQRPTTTEERGEDPDSDKADYEERNQSLKCRGKIQNFPREPPRRKHGVHCLTPSAACLGSKRLVKYDWYLSNCAEEHRYEGGGKDGDECFPSLHSAPMPGRASKPGSLGQFPPRLSSGRTAGGCQASLGSEPLKAGRARTRSRPIRGLLYSSAPPTRSPRRHSPTRTSSRLRGCLGPRQFGLLPLHPWRASRRNCG